jgi:preprotein translocase subunit SecG
MYTVVIVIHVAVCISLCIAVLLQQGKGADIGAVFGGSSQTVFGASGAGNILTKLTWGFAVVFFSTSIFLAYASTRRVSGSLFEGRVPAPIHSAPIGKATGPKIPATHAPAPNPASAPAPKK